MAGLRTRSIDWGRVGEGRGERRERRRETKKRKMPEEKKKKIQCRKEKTSHLDMWSGRGEGESRRLLENISKLSSDHVDESSELVIKRGS